MGYLVPVLAVVGIIGLLVFRWFVGKRVPGYFSIIEYWVYTDHTQIPTIEAIMDRMISQNPHNQDPNFAITAREGMLFTDIRLHMGLARREKNPHIFRPDLFEEGAVPTPEILSALADCKSMIKLRYASESVLNDHRQLQFMPHLADAVADLTEAKVVYDRVAEKLWTADDFHKFLAANANAERPECHIRVVWTEEPNGFVAKTLGLRKVGNVEIKTDPQEADGEVLITGLMMRLAQHLFRTPEDLGPIELEEFGDVFIITLDEPVEGYRQAHITRRHNRNA